MASKRRQPRGGRRLYNDEYVATTTYLSGDHLFVIYFRLEREADTKYVNGILLGTADQVNPLVSEFCASSELWVRSFSLPGSSPVCPAVFE